MRTTSATFILLVLSPVFAFAQSTPGFSSQGIFGCNRNAAALSNSVGAFSATGGAFVPVADYTVELNTGTLVYLECVLRGIVDRQSEAANVALIQKTLRFTTSGNDGNAYFQTKPSQQYLQASDQRALATFQDTALLNALNPKFAANVRRTAAISYQQQTRQRESSLACPDDGSNATGLDALLPMRNPACYALGAYNLYSDFVENDIRRCLMYVHDTLDWGRGFYSVVEGDLCNGGTIQTPGAYVEEMGLQALTSGFRRIENANNIDQMIGALYAGLGTQALTGSGGLLSGLTSAIGGSPSYLSQLVSESSQGLRDAASNAALGILASARAVEMQYNQIFASIGSTLNSTAAQIRGIESQCWSLIAYNTAAKHVCDAAPTGNTCSPFGTGTSTPSYTVKIATSTQFSQPIIDAQITPLSTQVASNLQKSQSALVLIDQLITAISNTASQEGQRLALVQLDQLVAQGKLHIQADVTAAQQQQGAVSSSMSQLVDQTKTQWADSATVDPGWCNVNNQAVIDFWTSKWK